MLKPTATEVKEGQGTRRKSSPATARKRGISALIIMGLIRMIWMITIGKTVVMTVTRRNTAEISIVTGRKAIRQGEDILKIKKVPVDQFHTVITIPSILPQTAKPMQCGGFCHVLPVGTESKKSLNLIVGSRVLKPENDQT